MKIEEQVTSLELSKKLKELGVKQDSLYYWKKQRPWDDYKVSQDVYREYDYCSAFTVAELDEMLPDTCQLRWLNGWGVCDEVGFHKPDDWYGANWIFEGLKRDQGADARAKMLIYLLENSLIELPKKTPEKLSA